ncbi:MAG: hypothetical protein R2751_13080 [Bacteroidales bacterium]
MKRTGTARPNPVPPMPEGQRTKGFSREGDPGPCPARPAVSGSGAPAGQPLGYRTHDPAEEVAAGLLLLDLQDQASGELKRTLENLDLEKKTSTAPGNCSNTCTAMPGRTGIRPPM